MQSPRLYTALAVAADHTLPAESPAGVLLTRRRPISPTYWPADWRFMTNDLINWFAGWLGLFRLSLWGPKQPKGVTQSNWFNCFVVLASNAFESAVAFTVTLTRIVDTVFFPPAFQSFIIILLLHPSLFLSLTIPHFPLSNICSCIVAIS